MSRRIFFILIILIMTAMPILTLACSSGNKAADIQGLVQSKRTAVYIPQNRNLVNGTITVKAGGYYDQSFTIDTGKMQNPSLSGSFTASGGSGNDIIVLVMDDMAFTNWVNGHQISTFYNSGKMTAGNIIANLANSGTYHLVYSNLFSTISTKNVTTNVNLSWSELTYQ